MAVDVLELVRLAHACARLEAVAAEVSVAVAPAERLSGLETWIGPAADDARVGIGSATRGVGEAAVALRRLAAQLWAEIEAAR